ncbi:macrophage mannose receptor 1 isoform X2 [Ictalurus punctatus]|uniref:Macrophage mannose receptor 1 isoform X2 n=1 Tax=Ictalurus punctatus TaxID=7998 RepID=A0A9F7TEF9_ICTPU|nr:macrophage mannose receptor 1 isoform X2 [Ictalurus punctatus]
MRGLLCSGAKGEKKNRSTHYYKLNTPCVEFRTYMRYSMVHLISMTLLLSVCGIGAYIPHHYHFVNENKTWSEAQNYCREKYTDLTSINDMGEMMKLNYTLKMETVKKAWIGLKREGTGEWQWSLADQTFYRDGDTYRNWNSGEPNNYGGNEFCVNMWKRDGFWSDVNCNKIFPFVCYEEKNSNTSIYMFINENKTWYDAQTYCREKHTDLVSVRNQTENEEIWKVIQSALDVNVWIGLFNNSWKWTDQSNSSFRYWSYDKPSGSLNCAAVNVSDQDHWTNVNCTEKLPFICHEKRLVLINQSLTWKEALNYCRNHHYDLVSVRTEEMQLWVKEVVQNASTEHVWLGLRHDCTQRIWFWVFGSMVCYQDWAPGNGTWNEDCSHERRSGAVQSGGKQQWIELSEGYKLNFICSTYDDMF